MKQKTIFSDIDGTLVQQVNFENIDPFTSRLCQEWLRLSQSCGNKVITSYLLPQDPKV